MTFTFIKGVVHAEGRLSADQLVAAGVALVGSLWVKVKVRVKFKVIVVILRFFGFFRSQDLLPPLPYLLLHLLHPLQLTRDPRLALIAAFSSLSRVIVVIVINVHDVTMTSVILAHDGVTQEALVQQVLRLAFLLHDDVKVGPVELELVTVKLGGSEHFVVFVVNGVVIRAAAP
jgi:hypothetical protein